MAINTFDHISRLIGMVGFNQGSQKIDGNCHKCIFVHIYGKHELKEDKNYLRGHGKKCLFEFFIIIDNFIKWALVLRA